jgi:hypothetical protein
MYGSSLVVVLFHKQKTLPCLRAFLEKHSIVTSPFFINYMPPLGAARSMPIGVARAAFLDIDSSAPFTQRYLT